MCVIIKRLNSTHDDELWLMAEMSDDARPHAHCCCWLWLTLSFMRVSSVKVGFGMSFGFFKDCCGIQACCATLYM